MQPCGKTHTFSSDLCLSIVEICDIFTSLLFDNPDSSFSSKTFPGASEIRTFVVIEAAVKV